MTDFKPYRRTSTAELRPYVSGEDLRHVSVAKEDILNGSPKVGDMIARNPANHADQWLVSADYFSANFETGDPKGLPVAGYKPTQSQGRIDLVNEGKILEERALRYIDRLQKYDDTFDQRFLAAGKTDIQKGFMLVFRAIFQPERIALPGDEDEPFVLVAGAGKE